MCLVHGNVRLICSRKYRTHITSHFTPTINITLNTLLHSQNKLLLLLLFFLQYTMFACVCVLIHTFKQKLYGWWWGILNSILFQFRCYSHLTTYQCVSINSSKYTYHIYYMYYIHHFV